MKQTKTTTRTTHLQQQVFIVITAGAYSIQNLISLGSIFSSSIGDHVPQIILFLFLTPVIYLLVSYPYIKHLAGRTQKLFYALLITDATFYVGQLLMTGVGYLSQYLPHGIAQTSGNNVFYATTVGATIAIELAVLTVLRFKKIL